MSQGSGLKFVVDIQNEEEIKKLTKDIEVQEAAIKKLNAQLKNHTINEQQFLAATKPMGEAIAKSTKEMQALQAASGTAGRGLSQLSYAIDDIQYGFNAIVNNIPQIVMGLGGSVGVAGAVGIAAVAINQLIKHWGELSDIAQTAWAGGSIEQLEKLRKGAEEAAAAFDKLTKEHTKQQEESNKFRHTVIVEGGIGKNLEGLAAGITKDPGLRAEENERQKLARRLVAFKPGQWRDDDPAERQLTEGKIRAELDEENRSRARAMLVAIEKGDKIAIANARRFAAANPGAFSKDFRDKLDPEAAEKDRVDKLNVDANIQGNKNIRAAEKKAEEERIHANKELTDKGIQYEKEGKQRLLETERHDLQEQIKRGEHMLTADGKRQLQDKLLGGVAPVSSSMMSSKAMADKNMIASFNRVPEKQLKKLEGMHITLKDIDTKLKMLGLQ